MYTIYMYIKINFNLQKSWNCRLESLDRPLLTQDLKTNRREPTNFNFYQRLRSNDSKLSRLQGNGACVHSLIGVECKVVPARRAASDAETQVTRFYFRSKPDSLVHRRKRTVILFFFFFFLPKLIRRHTLARSIPREFEFSNSRAILRLSEKLEKVNYEQRGEKS